MDFSDLTFEDFESKFGIKNKISDLFKDISLIILILFSIFIISLANFITSLLGQMLINFTYFICQKISSNINLQIKL